VNFVLDPVECIKYWEVSVGLFRWFADKGLSQMIPKNASEQYYKWKKKDPSLSEAEIAQSIFALRYLLSDPHFDRTEAKRFGGYTGGGFECQTLMDFCLASLDIEGQIDPHDATVFYEVSSIIHSELEKMGVKPGDDDISGFVGRWARDVAPYR
jgi:hypothetical protein